MDTAVKLFRPTGVAVAVLLVCGCAGQSVDPEEANAAQQSQARTAAVAPQSCETSGTEGSSSETASSDANCVPTVVLAPARPSRLSRSREHTREEETMPPRWNFPVRPVR